MNFHDPKTIRKNCAICLILLNVQEYLTKIKISLNHSSKMHFCSQNTSTGVSNSFFQLHFLPKTVFTEPLNYTQILYPSLPFSTKTTLYVHTSLPNPPNFTLRKAMVRDYRNCTSQIPLPLIQPISLLWISSKHFLL